MKHKHAAENFCGVSFYFYDLKALFHNDINIDGVAECFTIRIIGLPVGPIVAGMSGRQ